MNGLVFKSILFITSFIAEGKKYKRVCRLTLEFVIDWRVVFPLNSDSGTILSVCLKVADEDLTDQHLIWALQRALKIECFSSKFRRSPFRICTLLQATTFIKSHKQLFCF